MSGYRDALRELERRLTSFWVGNGALTALSVVLVLTIFVLFPLQESSLTNRIILDTVMSALLITGVLTVRRDQPWTLLAVPIVLAALVARWLGNALHDPVYAIAATALTITALLFMAAIVLIVVFFHGPVTWKRVQGGIAAYLLIGLAFAFAYHLAQQIDPRSMRFDDAPATPASEIAKLVYFSFVTLTTVGYGDITARSPFAHTLSIAEALIGQLFPTILIASLVTMALRTHARKD